jgi:hypothetical protein
VAIKTYFDELCGLDERTIFDKNKKLREGSCLASGRKSEQVWSA